MPVVACGASMVRVSPTAAPRLVCTVWRATSAPLASRATAVIDPAANGTAVHSAYDPAPSTIGRTDRAPTDLPLTTSSTVGAEVYAWMARVALPRSPERKTASVHLRIHSIRLATASASRTERHAVHRVEPTATGEQEYIISNLKKFDVTLLLIDRLTNLPATQQSLKLRATLVYENSQPVRAAPDEKLLEGDVEKVRAQQYAEENAREQAAQRESIREGYILHLRESGQALHNEWRALTGGNVGDTVIDELMQCIGEIEASVDALASQPDAFAMLAVGMEHGVFSCFERVVGELRARTLGEEAGARPEDPKA